MRYFWSFILSLVVLTVVLYTVRQTGGNAGINQANSAGGPAGTTLAPRGQNADPRSTRPAAQPESQFESQPVPALDSQTTTDTVERAAAPDAAGGEPANPISMAADESTSQAEPGGIENQATPEQQAGALAEGTPDQTGGGLSLDALLGVIEEASESQSTQAASATTDTPAQAVATTDQPTAPVEAEPEQIEPVSAGPAFTVRADGSVSVEGAGVIAGDGSPQRPFVIDWQVLRSVARDYDPKQGQSQLPAWLNELDGRTVRVEGNTLLPVVAPAVDELLVMQNPWDGCCVGIPPTPYDAIEVKLAELTRMGNTATGFGMVEGVFKVDPYIVQGWLLGLFVIENASFESAAGMTLPDL